MSQIWFVFVPGKYKPGRCREAGTSHSRIWVLLKGSNLLVITSFFILPRAYVYECVCVCVQTYTKAIGYTLSVVLGS